MRHVRLGRTGLPVSRLCLGTMTFGLQCDEPASAAIMDRAAAGGITFFDTADVYPVGGGPDTVGRTEEIVGRWLSPRRHDIVLATKCSGAMSGRPWDRGTSRKHILDAIEGSLRRLRTDYVDLYQLHHPDPATPIDETLRALDDVVRAGRPATSAARTSPRTRWRGRSAAARCSASAASIPCSRATTCSSGRSSGSSCPCAWRRASASFPITRSPAGSSPASTAARPGPPRGPASRSGMPPSAIRTATGTSGSSPPSTPCAPSRRRRPAARRARGGLDARASRHYLGHHRREPARAARRPPGGGREANPADLKARLDELTLEYRWGDDPR